MAVILNVVTLEVNVSKTQKTAWNPPLIMAWWKALASPLAELLGEQEINFCCSEGWNFGVLSVTADNITLTLFI